MGDTTAVALPNPPTTPVSLGDLISLALDTAKAVEAVYPAGAKGADKLAAVMALINEFAPLATVGAQIVEKLVPVFISAAVAEWNRIGAFVHSLGSAQTPAA